LHTGQQKLIIFSDSLDLYRYLFVIVGNLTQLSVNFLVIMKLDLFVHLNYHRFDLL